MFELDFLTSSPQSKDAYRRTIETAARILCESLPDRPYTGNDASSLAQIIANDVLPANGASGVTIAAIVATIASHSISISHPHTAAHLHCPPLAPALAAEVVISALNPSMDSFDQAPIATVIEQKVLHWLVGEVGLPASSGGTFTTGGTQSNYMALLFARDTCVEKSWGRSVQKSGLPAEASRLRIFCSDVAHFTVEKSASQLGLGADIVVRIPTNDQFRMDPSALHAALSQARMTGLIPMAIVATAGTTDFGSLDPLPEVAALAREFGAWFHVDAAYGGALVFSSHRAKLAAIEQADSIAIDFHKLLWQPIPCSVVLLRDAENFRFIKLNADYLNPESMEEEGVPNLVTTSLLTSRRFDALKLWISFQALGRNKLAAMIDRTIELAAHAADRIRQTPRLELVCEPNLSTVVFRCEPAQALTDADHLNAEVRSRLFASGAAVIGHTRVRGRQCLKFTLMNPATTPVQIEELIEKIVRQASNIESVG